MNKQTFLWGKLPEGWKLVELKDVSSYISRGKQPKYLENSDIRALNQKAVRWGEIDESVLKYHNPSVNIDEKHFIKQNDVVINSTGTGTAGRTYHFKYTPEKMFADSHITIVRTNEEILNSRFLMYQLSTKEYQNHIESAYLAGSTGQVEFNKSKVQQLPIVLPTIEEQEKIVDILSSLDNKIELNNEMNKTLEEMAQSIFKRWFVDFEFPNEDGETYKSSGGEMVDSELGMIPKGWEVKELGDVIKINPRESLKKGEEKIYVEMANLPLNYARVKNYIVKPFSGGTKFRNGDTLLARITPCLENGKTAIVDFLNDGELAFGSTEYIIMRPDTLNRYYIYCLARYDEFRSFAIKNMNGSSGRQRVDSNNIKQYTVACPSKEILELFNEFCKSIFVQMKKNDDESNALTEIRDILIPKLMSEEIIIK